MTINEAIKILEKKRNKAHPCDAEAFDLAIAALSAQKLFPKNIILSLTKGESKALESLVSNSNPCISGCYIHENENRNIDCEHCEFQEDLDSLTAKIYDILDCER